MSTTDLIKTIFLNDGERLLTYDFDGSMKLWDWRTEQLVESIDMYLEPISHFALSPDGTRLITSTRSGDAHLRDVRTWTPLARLGVAGGSIQHVQFSKWGDVVSATSKGRDLVALDGRRGQPISPTAVGIAAEGQD